MYLAAAIIAFGSGSSSEVEKPSVIVVVGAEGEEEFGKQFVQWADRWQEAAQVAAARLVRIGNNPTNNETDRERLRAALEAETKEGNLELWLVLIGHGTFDGRDPKFNLRGPDFSAVELAEWLKPFKRPVAVINTASASGPFIKPLAAAGRIVITATRSGDEHNFARFGDYLSQAIAPRPTSTSSNTAPDATSADLDKDGQVSLLEGYLMAARRTAEFYEVEGRLATEHSLLDDNGDGLGTPPDWFKGIRAVKRARENAPLDGLRAHQWHLIRSGSEQKMPAELRAKRDELELAVERLRDKKSSLPEDEYYKKLEQLLIEIARLYQSAGEKSR